MSLIKKLYDIGEDAFPNLFEVTIIGLSEDLNSKFKFRVQNFTIPQIQISTYEIKRFAQKIDRVKPSLDYDKKFSFNVRVDRYWEGYKGLLEWRNSIIDYYNDIYGEDIQNKLRLDINVKPITGNEKKDSTIKIKWDFKGCLITDIQEIEFNQETGEPIVLTINCIYIDLKENY